MEKTDPYYIDSEKLCAYLRARKNILVYEWDLLEAFYPGFRKNLEQVSAEEYDLMLFRYHFYLYHYLHKLNIQLEQQHSPLRVGISLTFIKMLEREAGRCHYFYESDFLFCQNLLEENTFYCAHHLELFSHKLPQSQSLRNFYLYRENVEKISPEDIRQMIKKFHYYIQFHQQLENACRVLEVDLSVKPEYLKKKYYQKIRKFHPDLHPAMDRRFIQEINQSYEVLSGFLKGT
jgi:hypothetical protein